MAKTLRNDDAKFGQQAADLVGLGGPCLDESLARPMDCQQGLLFLRLDCDESHSGPGNGLADGLGVGRVILVRLHVGLDELRRHQLDRMAHLAQFPGRVVCSTTRFHPDQTGLELDEKRQHLRTPQLLAQARLAMKVDTMYLKYRLCQIDTACTQLRFGRSFLVVDVLHIHCGTSMPFQEGCVHSIRVQSKPAFSKLRPRDSMKES